MSRPPALPVRIRACAACPAAPAAAPGGMPRCTCLLCLPLSLLCRSTPTTRWAWCTRTSSWVSGLQLLTCRAAAGLPCVRLQHGVPGHVRGVPGPRARPAHPLPALLPVRCARCRPFPPEDNIMVRGGSALPVPACKGPGLAAQASASSMRPSCPALAATHAPRPRARACRCTAPPTPRPCPCSSSGTSTAWSGRRSRATAPPGSAPPASCRAGELAQGRAHWGVGCMQWKRCQQLGTGSCLTKLFQQHPFPLSICPSPLNAQHPAPVPGRPGVPGGRRGGAELRHVPGREMERSACRICWLVAAPSVQKG